MQAPGAGRRAVLFEGPFRVVLEESEAGGAVRRRAFVEHPGAVVILARRGQELLFVRQFRPATGEELLELPAGTLEGGEEPLACAQRELQEECGYRAQELRLLSSAYAAPGYSSEVYHFILAEGLQPSRLPPDEDEEITLVAMDVEQARRTARQGGFQDTKTALGVLLLP